MIKQQQFFDIQPYKIDKLYSEPAKKLYKQISFKYKSRNLDIKWRNNSPLIQTSGTKIKEKFTFGLSCAISIKLELKNHSK